jgi:hypothetical protein
LTGRSEIDFERVQWRSESHCDLHYFYRFDRKAGDAELDLDLASRVPELKITNISPVAK